MTSKILFHLKYGSASWNRWREEEPETAIVLDGADLNGMIQDLKGALHVPAERAR